VGDAVGNGTGLSCPGTRHDAHRTSHGPGGRQLLGVEIVEYELQSSSLCSKRTVTASPACFEMAERTSVLIGSLWRPSPSAMNELRKGYPSTVPLTFTKPRVPKYSAEFGMTTYVHPPLFWLFSSVAVNSLHKLLMGPLLVRWFQYDGRRWRNPSVRCQPLDMVVVGVDGCKTGWIAVVLRGGHLPAAQYLPTIDALVSAAPDAVVVAIDIPIGLPDAGRREADRQAREFLRGRRNSVFFTPVRSAIEARTHALGTQAALTETGAGISRQAYALGRKIMEVERWLPSAHCPVYEVHPEVSFAVLLGAPATASKKSWAGMVQRRRALAEVGILLEHIDGVAAGRAAVDDMLDAAVAGWTAARLAQGTARSFPDGPREGPSGRRLAIWA
jgi:predicted RNase H-like nuclease